VIFESPYFSGPPRLPAKIGKREVETAILIIAFQGAKEAGGRMNDEGWRMKDE
jgi:hypothetical protein